MRATSRTELGRDTAGPLLPRANEQARSGLQEDEAKQVPLPGSVEPAGEQPFGRRVPSTSGPAPVEDVGRGADRRDARLDGRRNLVSFAAAVIRVALLRQLEQVV